MAFKIITDDKDPILRGVAKAVPSRDFARIAKLADEMVRYVKNPDNHSAGLAAPQIGQPVRVLAAALMRSYEDEVYRVVAMINPEIIEASPETEFFHEGCLSIPGVFGDVERPVAITVRYVDTRGKTQVLRLAGLPADVVQHEIDHLDGVLFTDKAVKDSLHRHDSDHHH